MESQTTPNQDSQLSDQNSTSLESVAITRIGVETELSRYPVHNLAKKGKVDIHIVKKKPDGQVELKWEVSYSERYGQARQLAYKLDTIIVNRRIDEEGRPLPRLVKIGSLGDVCRNLGLAESGRNKAIIKKGLLQNASAFITAKLKYRTNDGGERTLEAGFTRYSIVFTGERLPSGETADGVYLVLNDPYWEVLNTAPVRPLNYEYLKILAPAAQRFYEVISSRIYAAQKNRNPFARIAYSDFCTYSALTRHLDYENFRVQMAKIHRAHLKSGYIAKIHYEETKDGEGRSDWMLCYAPGPRARAEYMTFARKSKQLEAKAEINAAHATVAAGQGSASEPEPIPTEIIAPEPNDEFLSQLTDRGITATRAKKILADLAEGQQVLDQLEWGDYLVRSQPTQFKNPAGFYVYLITENVQPPANFETSRQRQMREQAQIAAQEEFFRQRVLEEEYDDYRRQQTDRYIRENLPQTELEQILHAKRKQLASQWRNFALLSAETAEKVLWGALRAEVAPRVPFLAFNEYCEQRSRQPGLFDGQSGQGSEPQVSEETLQAAYQDYRREQAQAAIAGLEMMERGRRRSAARQFLLKEHPDHDHFQHLISEERYDEFNKHAEEQLLEDTLKALQIPAFEVWKKTAVVSQATNADKPAAPAIVPAAVARRDRQLQTQLPGNPQPE